MEIQQIEQQFAAIDESTDGDFLKEAKKQIIIHAKLLERLNESSTSTSPSPPPSQYYPDISKK